MTQTTNVKVVALCGVTCSGKTSIAKLLADRYRKMNGSSNPSNETAHNNNSISDAKFKGDICVKTIFMDDYFLPESDTRHILVPELNHINWELMTSLDIEKMVADVTSEIER